MPRPFVLPDLGEGLTEAEIVKVLVREGDVIREDAPLIEVETDKAQVEIPSPMSGRVAKVHVEAGQTVKVGSVLVTFDDVEGNGARGARSRTTIERGPTPPAPAPGPGAAPQAGCRTPASASTGLQAAWLVESGRSTPDPARAGAGGRSPDTG